MYGMNWGGFGGRGEEGFNESIGNDGGGEGSHGNGLWKAKEGGEEEEDDEEGRERGTWPRKGHSR